MPSPTSAHRRGFTIPELLAVVAILTIILSILMPHFARFKEAARRADCRIHQRNIGTAMINFSVNNRSFLPGNYLSPWSWDEEEKRCWIGKEAYGALTYEGALVKYLGGVTSARENYRCPSLPAGVFNSGVGSNGFFDYCSLLVFSGARRHQVPGTSDWVDPTSGIKRSAPTPLIVEEDPMFYLNRGNIEPGHSAADRTGTWHQGAANYIAFDGHSTSITPDGPLGPQAFDWTTRSPSGVIVNLSSHGSGWGGWATR